MSSIEIYVIDKQGRLDHVSTGSVESVVASLNGLDFTLTKPPNFSQLWYWYDNAWQETPKQS